MSSTNKTTNYQLSQFVGTDIPSILNDYNGDMRKIDTAIKEVSNAGGDNASDISELQSTVGRHTTEIGGLGSTVNALSGRVIGIEGKIPANASAQNQLVTKNDINHGIRISSYSANHFATIQSAFEQLERDVRNYGLDLHNVYILSDTIGELMFNNGIWQMHTVKGEDNLYNRNVEDISVYTGAGSNTGAVIKTNNNISSIDSGATYTSRYSVTDVSSSFLGDIIEVYTI